MTFHPREPWRWRRPMSRREMIRLSSSAFLAGTVVAACGDSSAPRAGSGSTTKVRVGTPENPVTHPITDDNPPIESGLEPEAGPLKLYNWADYIWPKVLKDFAKEYDVEFELTTFYNLEEATRKLSTGEFDFDVFFPTAENVPKMVAGQILQPLNHDYLPNLDKHVWPMLQDPYYDVGSRFTVPYTVYETGIGWRTDMIDVDIESMDNPWEVFWDPAVKDKAGLYDDYRETIGVALYKNGILDINTDDPDEIEQAGQSLVELIDLVNIRYTIDGAYSKLPEGKFGIHHAWSGDLVAAPFYVPKGQDPEVLRWMWPPKNAASSSAGGYVSNDALGIPKNAKNPVLAHMFLDFLLDPKHGVDNFSWVGYQPPLNELQPDSLVEDGYVAPYLESAVIEEADFEMGQRPIQLRPEVERLWLDAWSKAQSGG